jgi:cytochrome c oxidase assembly factor CtaG
LTDQQFGAGIMWVPGSITYSIVFIGCIYLWFRAEDARAAQSPSPLAAQRPGYPSAMPGASK